jgi:hypothetical protein
LAWGLLRRSGGSAGGGLLVGGELVVEVGESSLQVREGPGQPVSPNATLSASAVVVIARARSCLGLDNG